MNNTPQEDGEIKFVILTQDILADKELTLAEKFVLARISGFETFYESNEATGELLGISPRTVKTAKQTLERLGYIRVIANNGHGKKYTTNYGQMFGRGQENCHLGAQITPPGDQNYAPENKIENKLKNIINAPSANDDSSKEYGRADINELIRTWSEQVYDIQGDKTQRRYAYNLIRKYGAEGAQRLVERVSAMKRKNDRFAPNIAKLSDLMGKYSKLDKLEAWEQRQQAESKPNEPQYTPPPPYFRTPDLSDYGDAWREVPDEEFERVSQQIKEARAKMPFFNKGGKK